MAHSESERRGSGRRGGLIIVAPAVSSRGEVFSTERRGDSRVLLSSRRHSGLIARCL